MDSFRDTVETSVGGDHPLYPGAVGLVLHDGVAADQVVVGDAVRYTADRDGVRPLPPDQRVPMRLDTGFDLASLSKLFTATVALALVDRGQLTLDQPVSDHLPELADAERDTVTIRQLLSHTSGLPSLLRLWELPTRAARIDAVLTAPLERPPGRTFEYSCVGYLLLGFLLEKTTGSPLPKLVADIVTTPLGLADTTYLPTGELAGRTAATEHQPSIGRGVVRASVHDENAWSLGGAAGNAGLFSTVADLARFGEMLRRGGDLDGTRVLSEAMVAEMTTDQLPAFLDPGYRQGLGPRIAAPDFMGALAAHHAFGHAGFTGTSLVIDPVLGTVTVLLTNRVHPSRDWSDIAAVRRSVADHTATLARQPTPDGVG